MRLSKIVGITFITLIYYNYGICSALEITVSGYNKPQGVNTYGPQNLKDGDIRTAWCISASNKPVITIKGNNAGKVAIFNGYQKNYSSYLNNSRAKVISIEAGGSGNLNNELVNSMSPQFVDLAPNGEINIRIESYYPGRKYNDLCISELIFDQEVIDMLRFLVKDPPVTGSEKEFKLKYSKIYRNKKSKLINSIELANQDKSKVGLKHIINLMYYSQKYDNEIQAEMLEVFSDIIASYFENSDNDLILSVLSDEKQRGRVNIVASFDNYFSTFSFEEGTNRIIDKRYDKKFKILQVAIEKYRKKLK